MDHLLKLLKSNSVSSIASSFLTQIGCNPCAFSSCLIIASWIIDSGASDHMTSLSNLFKSYSPSWLKKKKVRIVYGSFSPIVGKESIKIFENIVLNYVVHVPKLPCNLLSISKLHKDPNYLVTFFNSHHVF